MSTRFDMMMEWLRQVSPRPIANIAPASNDASFRRYFRVDVGGISRIVMDAPPELEDCGPFIRVAGALASLGLHVPAVLEADLERGFLLLTDLGDRLYLHELDEGNVDGLYGDALDALARLQRLGDPACDLLPDYGAELLMQELELFREWFLERQLGLTLAESEREVLDDVFALLCDNALEQPRVWVHRDYHSRNLMITPEANPGILDFQGAVIGPITYDLVSLLRDCYIAWPRSRVESWALAYWTRLRSLGLTGLGEGATFLRWFDLMGVQRHLKAAGIFARLYHRDGRPGYLQNIPRTLAYVLEASERYRELAGLRELLRTRVSEVR